MIKNYLIIIFLFTGISFSFAQEVTFDKVKQQYENFKYDEVIKLSDQLIEKGNLSDSLAIELQLMRANIFYSAGADSSARNSFENILKIKRNYVPDPDITSPKLIAIFNEVKSDYLRANPDLAAPPDSASNREQIKFADINPQRDAVIKNILLPGLGQLHNGNSLKGWIITSASVLNLGSLVYFAVDAGNKQSDYMSETDKNLIRQKYDDYNKAYKIRNALILSYAVIWLYSQIDLLFFPDNHQPAGETGLSRYFDLNSSTKELNLNIKIPF